MKKTVLNCGGFFISFRARSYYELRQSAHYSLLYCNTQKCTLVQCDVFHLKDIPVHLTDGHALCCAATHVCQNISWCVIQNKHQCVAHTHLTCIAVKITIMHVIATCVHTFIKNFPYFLPSESACTFLLCKWGKKQM